MGCAGAKGVDCHGSEEQYWFGDEREWQLNLPEITGDWASQVGALVVNASIELEYRATAGQKLEASCAEATHVITRARFGHLRVEAEPPRTSTERQNRWLLTTEARGVALVDVTLEAVGHHATSSNAGARCMGLAGYRSSWAPASFRGESYIAPPEYCVVECGSGLFDCAKSCAAGVRATCQKEFMGSAPGANDLLRGACTAGFGESCGAQSGSTMAELTAVCEQGGDLSARVCGELSTLSSGDRAVGYAWMACERGRVQCDRVAELLRAARQTADARYGLALRYGCASGQTELCCDLGLDQLQRVDSKAVGAQILSDYCARSQQACCRALREHGYPVPARRRQPD